MRNHSARDGNGRSRDASKRLRPGPWLPLGVTALTLGVFIGAILLIMHHVRGRINDGFLREDGEVLLAAINAKEAEEPPAESAQDWLALALKASEFRDKLVWGVRLYDQEGKFILGLPKNLAPIDLTPTELAKVRARETAGSFYPRMHLGSQFINPEEDAVGPVVKSTIPISSGAAQFLLDGERVQKKLAIINHDVRVYSFWLCLVGGLLITATLGWAFGRLERSNKLLSERTSDLLRANHELTLAAKTSAVGAVAAHLIHGLKNPLVGLQMFVSNQLEENQRPAGDREWRLAADATRRMQQMIGDIVRILQEDAGEQYEVSLSELAQILEAKVLPMAREKDVRLQVKTKASGALANREANLMILALTNLIQNAIQASKPGGKVELSIYPTMGPLCFDVMDEAGGVPEEVREVLFTPCHSTKPGGTGLGLAITKQLANHMGGQLELVETNQRGSIFRLSVPSTLFLAATEANGKFAANPAT
jgi:signal transduction histidine kinase